MSGNWTNEQSNILESVFNFYTINLVGPEFLDYFEIINYNKTRTYKIRPSHKLFKTQPSENFLFVNFNLFTFRLLMHKLRHSIWWDLNGRFLL